VISVDRDFKNIQYQKEVQSKSETFENWKIQKRNVFTFLSQNTELFDIVFADPPYDLPNIQKLPDLILPHVKKGGLFVLEHAPQLVFPQEGTLKKEYGSTSITIFVSND
jgi:16S rRNA G966 N2-methylase RsmD